MTDPAARKRQRQTRSKADAIEYQKRIETVRRLILDGTENDVILRNIAEAWQVKPRMAQYYISRARAKNQAWIDFNTADMFAHHIAFRRYLREKAMMAGDLKTALQSAIDEAKMFGLYAPTKIDVGWESKAKELGYNPDQLSPALLEFLRAMIAKRVNELPPTIEQAADTDDD